MRHTALGVAVAVALLAACGPNATPTSHQAAIAYETASQPPRAFVPSAPAWDRTIPEPPADPAPALPAARRAAPPAKASRSTRGRSVIHPPAAAAGPATGDLLDRLAQCESHGNPRDVSASGKYLGAFQFSLATWHANGGTGSPLDHTYAEQKTIAARIPVSAWGSQFPTCSRKLGVA